MTSILDRLVDNSTGDFYTDIVENCGTYKDFGELLQELLEYFGGANNWDDRTADFLEEMYSEYYNQVIG